MSHGSPHVRLLDTAIEAVLRAGEIQMAHFGQTMQVDKKGAINLVTNVDLEVERVFREMIGTQYPDHAILGEELETTGAEGCEYRWVFDPIDGTTNYAHGLPIFCAAVALEIEGRTALGAIYDPSRKELFTAERGRGAYCNGNRLHVSATSSLLDSLLCTGFPYTVHETLDEIVGLFAAFVGRARAVRRLGSAALDLCYVAAGRLDGFWEQGLQIWDTAAGVLMVAEAGGLVTSYDGGPYAPGGDRLVASNVQIHEEMIETIRHFLSTRSQYRTS